VVWFTFMLIPLQNTLNCYTFASHLISCHPIPYDQRTFITFLSPHHIFPILRGIIPSTQKQTAKIIQSIKSSKGI
jgi:hypothetical protein